MKIQKNYYYIKEKGRKSRKEEKELSSVPNSSKLNVSLSRTENFAYFFCMYLAYTRC